MKSLAVLLGIIVLTSLAFWPITTMAPGDDAISATRVLGFPVLAVASDEIAWLSLGFGYGAVFIGLAGAGIVAIGLAGGGGFLFGTGQLSCGLIAVGQVAVAVVFAIGQIGVGIAGIGQLLIGGLVKGQVEVGKDGGSFLSQLNKDIDRLLWPGRGAGPRS
jgi:hypothetical protein